MGMRLCLRLGTRFGVGFKGTPQGKVTMLEGPLKRYKYTQLVTVNHSHYSAPVTIQALNQNRSHGQDLLSFAVVKGLRRSTPTMPFANRGCSFNSHISRGGNHHRVPYHFPVFLLGCISKSTTHYARTTLISHRPRNPTECFDFADAKNCYGFGFMSGLWDQRGLSNHFCDTS